MEEPAKTDNQSVTTVEMDELRDNQLLLKEEEFLQATFESNDKSIVDDQSRSTNLNVKKTIEDKYDKVEKNCEVNKNGKNIHENTQTILAPSILDLNSTEKEVDSKADSLNNISHQSEQEEFCSLNQFPAVNSDILIQKDDSIVSLENSDYQSFKDDTINESEDKQGTLMNVELETEDIYNIKMISGCSENRNQNDDQLHKTDDNSLDDQSESAGNNVVENLLEERITDHETESSKNATNFEQTKKLEDTEDSDIRLVLDDSGQDASAAEEEKAAQTNNEHKMYTNIENKSSDCNSRIENECVSTEEYSAVEEQSMGNEDELFSDTNPETSATEIFDETDETVQPEETSNTTKQTGFMKIIITWTIKAQKLCKQCKENKICKFRLINSELNETEYICDQECCNELVASNRGKYLIRRRKIVVEEKPFKIENENISENDIQKCLRCNELKNCQYFLKQDEETFYICGKTCFNAMNNEEPDMFNLKHQLISEQNIDYDENNSASNERVNKNMPSLPEQRNSSQLILRTTEEAEAARHDRALSYIRKCAECLKEVLLDEKKYLTWETMDFCAYECLEQYQRKIGSHCRMCEGNVVFSALGKYCVRFGFNIRQFCCASCLNEFKKGLKSCFCCQEDISTEKDGFLASVGQNEQFKDFCSQTCMQRYENLVSLKKTFGNNICGICNNDKPVRVELTLDEKDYTFCSNPCFSAFKFVNNIVADQCGMCCKYFERKSIKCYTIYIKKRAKVFCSRICLNVFMVNNRYIISCRWCKVKKYNFDMIVRQDESQNDVICSLNCLSQQCASVNAPNPSLIKCDNCGNMTAAQYQLNMSDDSLRFFCTYQCVMQFQGQFSRSSIQEMDKGSSLANSIKNIKNNGGPFPSGVPKRVKYKLTQQTSNANTSMKKEMPEKKGNVATSATCASISSNTSDLVDDSSLSGMELRRTRTRNRKLDSPTLSPVPSTQSTGSVSTSGTSTRGRPRKNANIKRSPSPSPPTINSKRHLTPDDKQQYNYDKTGVSNNDAITGTKIIVVPPLPHAVRNVQTNCKPHTSTIGIQCESEKISVGVQTSADYSNKVLIPVPVPLYIPQPMYMYSLPFPVPVPIPLPIPVPIFIPTTRNSAEGIMKEIKKIQDKMPADPYEAELLMMAEMVAEEKQESDSGSEGEIKPDPNTGNLQYNNNVQNIDVTNNAYGDDVLQIALKMASNDYEQPSTHTVDMESAMATNTIINPATDILQQPEGGLNQMTEEVNIHLDPGNAAKGQKRVLLSSVDHNGGAPFKRSRILATESNNTANQPIQQLVQIVEKPDANMCLKYTFGVNAWKQWVMTKNVDLEKNTSRRRPFKTELLQMTADELNYTLCLFVKEVRKPNGTEYAPDTIYYLVLGIQQYLYENGRIDNIFTDPYYEPFTNCLDEVAKKFSILYNDSQYIVTRVEEEHLWECKQLGAHSPHVLLSTLMFFNTKHFNLTTVEEHMQLSFSHIMKHWKRNVQNTKTTGSRNVLLRFYPPQSELNTRKKKVYEQQENEENPLRCPVRLYEFYLSKCPESVKTRNDVFYLQPERSCVPDSPVWYSTQMLSKESLQKMLHRVKMVKEINIALLTS